MIPYQLEPAPGRVPPADLDAEAAVLSAVLLDSEALDLVRDILAPEHMYADANNKILTAIYAIQDCGQPVDLVSVAGFLRDADQLGRIGGPQYLALICDATPAVAHVEDHARRVKEKARQRRMIRVCQKHAAEGYFDIGKVPEWLDRVEQDVFEAAENDTQEEHAESMADILPVVLKDLNTRFRSGGSVAGIPTGWKDIDNLLNGWIAGKLYILAGRPGMGKSGISLAAAINVAKQGKAAIFVSAEMTRYELAQRAACLLARVPIERVMAGYVSAEELTAITIASAELGRLPLVLSERPGATIAQVRSDIRRKFSELRKRFEANTEWVAKFGPELELGMVVVDYLQIMNGMRQKGDSRENEVSALSKGLMWLAGELKVTVVALSQLNRSVETREDKRPINSDLRESGSLEQDAYAIIFIYRDEYYNKNSEDKGIAEANVTKHRNGKTGCARLGFNGEWVEFSTLDTRPEEIQQFDDFGDHWAPNE